MARPQMVVLAVLGVLGASETSEVCAQPVVTRIVGSSDRADEWQRALAAQGAVSIEDVGPQPPTVPRSRVQILSRVSDLLVQARAAAGRLAEGEALSLLTRGRLLLEAHADVPGVSRWLAEVETMMGIVASQAGLDGLADGALIRAVSLDELRDLRPGEAAPAVVARAHQLAAQRATAPEGRFEVVVDAPGARVFLDDREVGAAPVEVRAPVGRHIVRVEAPGRRAWGRGVDVLAGRRATIRVHLALSPRRRALRDLAQVETLQEASELTARARVRLWWLEIGDGPETRALLYECGPSGCSAPVRRTLGPVWHEPGPPIPWARLERARLMAWRWVRQPTRGPDLVDRPLRRRWELWLPVGLAVAAGALGLGLALRPDPSRQFRTRIDFGDLTPE